MRTRFIQALRDAQNAFAINLTDSQIEGLAHYYDLVREQNKVLNLVGPCTPDEFATRHILESLTLLLHLPTMSKFADVGTGAGLPSIPCLIVREDLKAVLIESKEKKARFLENAIEELGLRSRATVANRQFEEVDAADCDYVTCRALDKFTEKLPRLIRWAGPRTMLLFGGNGIGEALQKLKLTLTRELLPMSDQRYLYITRPSD